MAKKNDFKKDLGYLNEETQITIVKNIVENKEFFLSIHNILDQNLFSFTNSSLSKLKEVVAIMLDTFNESGKIATYKDISIKLNSKARTDIDIEENEAVINILKDDKYYDGSDIAMEEARSFFLRAALRGIGEKIKIAAENNLNIQDTYENYKERFEQIGQSSVEDKETNPIDLMDDIFSEELVERVPTGIPQIDLENIGGFEKRHVGLVIAGTGAGKTTFMTILANNAALAGKKVLHIFFEETEIEIGRKYIARNTGIFTNTMNATGDYNLAKSLISSNTKKLLKENLRLKRMANGDTTPDMIKTTIIKLINKGFKPDVVFIDYFSCLKKTGNDNTNMQNECQAGERAMKKLNQMAQDLDILIMVAEQTNRNGVKFETAHDRIANVQGSYRITQPCSYIFYLDRVGKAMNEADLFLDKTRLGPKMEWRNIYLNNGNLELDLSERIPVNEKVVFTFDNKDNEHVDI